MAEVVVFLGSLEAVELGELADVVEQSADDDVVLLYRRDPRLDSLRSQVVVDLVEFGGRPLDVVG